MFEDRYGLPVTTTSADAFALFADALDRALASRDGARPRLEQATTIDPNFALAWALLGLQLRLEGDMKGGTALIDRAAAIDNVTDREHGQFAMLQAFCRGRFADAEALADAHLTRWPGDAIVMLQANFVFNLLSAELDRRETHHDLAQRTLAQNPDDWYFLGEAAFAAAEVSRYDEARGYAARSFATNPHNADAAHAVAHVFFETGDGDGGAAWMTDWLPQWDAPSPFACHLAWHLALFAVIAGRSEELERDALLEYLDRPLTLLMDAGSLFWRLRLAGTDALPWGALVDLPSPPGYSLSNFHRAFVLAGLGDVDALRDWSALLRRNVERGHPSAAVCAAVVDAIGAHAQGDYAACAKQLESVEADVPRLGGSRAQLEVLDDTLIDSLGRAGRASEPAARLDVRLARRGTPRDRAWRDRLR